jgi:hypothetical protein
MTRTELLIPEPQEAIVVDRFSDQASSIVPGMEITLAKRIIRPGSNRVMCLAARTSVPLSDDDVASVSNLSLRLSDGTNVALSLSFFNDLATNEGVPLNRYYYDPQRYRAQSGSHLGVVLVATALVAATGLYYVLGNTLLKHQHSATPAKAAALAPGAVVHKQPLPYSKTAAATTTAGKAETQTRNSRPEIQPGRENAEHTAGRKFALLKPRFEQSRAKSAADAVHTSAPRAPRSNFLVPPPPPVMYNLPSGMPNFDFMQRMMDPPKSAAKSKPASSVKSDRLPAVPSTPTQLFLSKGSAADLQQQYTQFGQTASPTHQAFSAPQALPAQAVTDSAWVPGGKENDSVAPLPGAEYPPLERIVIPPAPAQESH